MLLFNPHDIKPWILELAYRQFTLFTLLSVSDAKVHVFTHFVKHITSAGNIFWGDAAGVHRRAF